MNEVIFNRDDIIKIDYKRISDLKVKAAQSPLKKVRLCLHKNISDTLHEMIIVICKGNYVRPHRHPNKTESFHIIDGAMTLIVFDNNGKIIDRVSMDDRKSGGCLLVKIEKDYCHMVIPLTDFVIFHETTTGPFTGIDDTVFPAWAPEDNDIAAINKFIGKIMQ